MRIAQLSCSAVLLTLLNACGSSTSTQSSAQPEAVPEPIPESEAESIVIEPGAAPYDYAVYKAVIDDAYLQTPTSTKLIGHGDFEGKYNQYFFIPRTGNAWMTFRVTGDHNR